MQIKSLHSDELLLKLEYPEDLTNFTDLNDEEFTNTFEIFSRILFDNLMTKERKSFEIIYNEDEKRWQYIFETQMKEK